MSLPIIRWISSKIASVVLAVGTDFVLGRVVLAITVLTDGSCKTTGLLVSSFRALSLRIYGYLVLSVFI